MSATARFKKDFGYYLLGIIVPGLLNAAMVPILKHLLGTEDFGSYSLKFNFLLLLIATLFGGLCQGVIRFKANETGDLPRFYTNVFLIGWRLLGPFVILSFLMLRFYFNQSYLLSVLYALCLIGCFLQNIIIAISQASFLSRYIIFSESIRAILFFALAIAMLLVINVNPESLLFLALLLSYIGSSLLLIKRNRINWRVVLGILPKVENNKKFDTKSILMYGLPLVFWYSIYGFLLYLDKPLIAKKFGLLVQGNYQAMFDMIFRGITFLMAPISTAIFPILNQSTKQEILNSTYSLLKKIFFVEMMVLGISLFIYWHFGFLLLSKLLLIPNLMDYKLCGAMVISFSILWQMALIAHKPLEVAKRTDIMCLFIFISFAIFSIVFFCLGFFLIDKIYIYTVPCLVAAIVYNMQCIGFYVKHNKKRIR